MKSDPHPEWGFLSKDHNKHLLPQEFTVALVRLIQRLANTMFWPEWSLRISRLARQKSGP